MINEIQYHIENDLDIPREYTLIYDINHSNLKVYRNFGSLNEEYLYKGNVDCIEDVNGILNDLNII